MQKTFFIGDTHFGHKNIMSFEPVARPFSSLEEMHEVMIDRWNSVVGPGDIVYHLGDFCFGKGWIWKASLLNGDKRLILGNHDPYPMEEYLKYFKWVRGVYHWKDCILTHIPIHPNGLGKRFKFNIHGHLHSKTVGDDRYINVSCERNNLYPINATELFK